MILGMEAPTGGTIRLLGQDLAHIRGTRSRKLFMGAVQPIFQNPFEAFNPLRQLDHYLFLTARRFGDAGDQQQALASTDTALRQVGLSLPEVAGRYPHELSGGQLQRAAIARALLAKPKLIVADEPVSMVDASLRMSIVNLFKTLRDELGISIIYITHDLATAYYISNRIMIMKDGRVVESGDARTVLATPQHPYSRQLKEAVLVPQFTQPASASVSGGNPHEASQRPPRSRFCHRRDRPAPVWRLRRASRALRLWRHLRTRPSDRRREGLPGRRAGAGQGARADHHALSRRQFRLRLQLGGRGGPAQPASDQAGPRLVLDRAQHVRHQRVHGLVPRRAGRADACGQSRHARRRCRTQSRRVLQSPLRQPLRGPAACPRLREAARREVLVPRQRNGRPLADGAQDRHRIRPRRRRGRQVDAVGRPDPSCWRPAARPRATCRPSGAGTTRCSSTPSS